MRGRSPDGLVHEGVSLPMPDMFVFLCRTDMDEHGNVTDFGWPLPRQYLVSPEEVVTCLECVAKTR